MRRSRAEKEKSHERIVKAAAQRFRERGFDHVSVDELMAEAGLTRGGFYKHFASRDALVTEALARAFEDGRVRLGQLMAAAAGSGLEACLDVYLNETHRDHPAQGCPVAALIGDVARTPPAQAVFRENFRAYADWVGGLLGGARKSRRARGIAVLCALAGAVGVARALGDDELSDVALAATRELILEAAKAGKHSPC
jgi:TetR/AcrR family transcriptional regulator, transcriptional repressor for nem operon